MSSMYLFSLWSTHFISRRPRRHRRLARSRYRTTKEHITPSEWEDVSRVVQREKEGKSERVSQRAGKHFFHFQFAA